MELMHHDSVINVYVSPSVIYFSLFNFLEFTVSVLLQNSCSRSFLMNQSMALFCIYSYGRGGEGQWVLTIPGCTGKVTWRVYGGQVRRQRSSEWVMTRCETGDRGKGL